MCTYINLNLTDQTYFDANAGSSLDGVTQGVAHRCLFEDGDLAVEFDIETDLGHFYTLMDEIDTALEKMNDPEGDI